MTTVNEPNVRVIGFEGGARPGGSNARRARANETKTPVGHAAGKSSTGPCYIFWTFGHLLASFRLAPRRR